MEYKVNVYDPVVVVELRCVWIVVHNSCIIQHQARHCQMSITTNTDTQIWIHTVSIRHAAAVISHLYCLTP